MSGGAKTGGKTGGKAKATSKLAIKKTELEPKAELEVKLEVSQKIRDEYKGLPEECFTLDIWPHSFLKLTKGTKGTSKYVMDKDKIKAFCLQKGLKPEHPLSQEKIQLIALQIKS